MTIHGAPPQPSQYDSWQAWADSLLKWLRHDKVELSVVQLPIYSMATLPKPNQDGMLIFLSDEAGGGVPVYSFQGVWLKANDRLQVSKLVTVPAGALVLTGQVPTAP